VRQSDGPGDPYAAIARYYDLEHDRFSDDLGMYQHIVEMVGDPVLELACGSGRILSAVTAPGRRLVGVDTSQPMLDRARARFANHAAAPDLRLGEMTEPVAEAGTFGIVIVGLSSLHHVETQTGQIAVLKTAFQALDPRGMLVLDLINPLAALAEEDAGLVHLEAILGDGPHAVMKFSTRQIIAAQQQIANTIWYDEPTHDGAMLRTTTSMSLRLVFPAELDLMLTAAGFVGSEQYGNYELDPFTATSPRLIVMAEKT